MKKLEFLEFLSALAQQSQAVYSDNSFASAHRALAAERVSVLTTVLAVAKSLDEGLVGAVAPDVSSGPQAEVPF